MIAYTYANGVIYFGQRVPKGALMIAKAKAKLLREKVGVIARWSYPTKRGGNDSVPLVPGIPEAKDQSAALEALIQFKRDLEKRLGQAPPFAFGNPWASKIAGHLDCQTCDAGDRISMIGVSQDVEWLKRVVAWPENQRTVQQAAERRLRRVLKLQKAAA